MRTVLVSKDTTQARAATSFLRYLTSSNWSTNESTVSLPSLRAATDDTPASTITLEPGLMIFLDRLKRQAFIKEWENAVIQ